jgi:hypothetical protein
LSGIGKRQLVRLADQGRLESCGDHRNRQFLRGPVFDYATRPGSRMYASGVDRGEVATEQTRNSRRRAISLSVTARWVGLRPGCLPDGPLRLRRRRAVLLPSRSAAPPGGQSWRPPPVCPMMPPPTLDGSKPSWASDRWRFGDVARDRRDLSSRTVARDRDGHLVADSLRGGLTVRVAQRKPGGSYQRILLVDKRQDWSSLRTTDKEEAEARTRALMRELLAPRAPAVEALPTPAVAHAVAHFPAPPQPAGSLLMRAGGSRFVWTIFGPPSRRVGCFSDCRRRRRRTISRPGAS